VFKYITKNAIAEADDYDNDLEYYLAKKIGDKLSLQRFDNDVVCKRLEKLFY